MLSRSKLARVAAPGAVALAAVLAVRYKRSKQKPLVVECEPLTDNPSDSKEKPSSKKRDAAKRRKQLGEKYRRKLLQKLLPASLAQLGWLTLLCLGRTLLNDRLSRVQGWLFQSTFETNFSSFAKLLLEDVLLNVVFSCWKATIDYRVGSLALRWRSIVNDLIANDYFRGMTYYKVAFVDKRIQNPEQVIVTDTDVVTSELAEICSLWIGAIIDGSYFTWRLAKVTNPKWASLPIAYIAGAIVATQSLSPNFGKLYSLKQKAETSLRRVFSNLRTHVEAIAAFGGGEREKGLITARADDVIKTGSNLYYTQCWFGMLEDFIAKYCVTTVAVIIIMGPNFRKSGTVAVKTNSEILSKMRYMTSITVFQLYAVGGLARVAQKSMKLSSYIERVGEFLEVLQQMRKNFSHQHNTSVIEGQQIEFKDVEVVTPTGNSLVKNLSFDINPGSNMLITGPNGAGKSSIFRCLGSLWTVKQGTIVKPSINDNGLCDDVFYLPQKPYNVVGDLRDQLTYPSNSKKARDAITQGKLEELLMMVDLQYLLERDTAEKVNWESELSLGETQRLAMARLFYHAPTYAILDECTSGVSTDMEVRLYQICAKMNITCVTISHRPALEAFHHKKLALDGKGSYDVEVLEDAGSALATPIATPALSRTSSSERLTKKKAEESSASMKYGPLTCTKLEKSDQMLSNFKRLADIVWSSTATLTTKKLSLLTGIVIARVYLSDRIAHLNGLCLQALLGNDVKKFSSLVKFGFVQSAIQAVLAPTLIYMARSLSLDWREAIGKHIFKKYFSNKLYYKIGNLYHIVEDADHRLTEDLDKLSVELANIFPDIVKPMADISWFTYQSWRIIGLKSTAFLYSYMILGFGVLRVVTPAFGALVQKSQELTSSFRYVHTRLRTHAESIAFFGGDEVEGKICESQFKELVKHQKTYLNAQWWHTVFDDFIIKQFPPIVTWALSFACTTRISKITNIYSDNGGQLSHDIRYLATTVSHMFLAFGELLDLYKRMAELSGYASRVLEVERGLVAIEDRERQNVGEFGKVLPSDDVVFNEVDIVTPLGHCLVSNVSCTIPRTQNLLVTGPNVSGKSSLFRVLGGLWPVRSGTLHRPLSGGDNELKNVFMVPQKPYNAIGSLGQQLTYPDVPDLSDPNTTTLLMEILAGVGLAYLVHREGGWNATANWADVLSLGEQQRLGMARLFYHRPKFAVLDQCTDAVSVDVEEALYEKARNLGITIITISQRPALTGHHDQKLSLLDGQGGWSLSQKVNGAWEK